MAFAFDGTGSSGFFSNTAVDSNVTFDSTNGFTVGGWFWLGNTTQTNRYLSALRRSNQCSIIYGFSAAGEVEFFHNTISGYRTNSQITISSAGWHHIIYRMGAGGRTGGDTAVWDYFLDGAKTTINATFSDGMPNVNNAQDIGICGAIGSDQVYGGVEEFYHYKTALSDAAVQQLYTNSAFSLWSIAEPAYFVSMNRMPPTDSGTTYTLNAYIDGFSSSPMVVAGDYSTTTPNFGGPPIIYPSNNILAGAAPWGISNVNNGNTILQSGWTINGRDFGER